jgi:replicative DNA helicase
MRAVRKGAKVVFVDHIHKASNHLAGRTQENEISGITGTLARLARQTRTVCVALSQLNQDGKARGSRKPVLSDLRGSKAIEQDADNVTFCYREGKDDSIKGENVADTRFEFIIAKNREGTLGTIKLGWDGRVTKYYELEEK